MEVNTEDDLFMHVTILEKEKRWKKNKKELLGQIESSDQTLSKTVLQSSCMLGHTALGQ